MRLATCWQCGGDFKVPLEKRGGYSACREHYADRLEREAIMKVRNK